MTDTKTASKARSSAAKSKASEAAMPEFEAFAMPKMEVPEVLREAAEKSIGQARDAYAKIKTAAEDATDLMEDTFETSRQGVLEFNHKALDAAKTNTDATFSFFKDMMAVKTVAEALELQSSFARQQFDVLSSQAKEMQDLASKLGSEVAAPVKDAMEKNLKDVKAA